MSTATFPPAYIADKKTGKPLLSGAWRFCRTWTCSRLRAVPSG